MTDNEWLDDVTRHQDRIKTLIRSYHPVNRQPGPRKGVDHITAPNTEAACVNVRKSIRDNYDGDPIAHFDRALADRNISALSIIMNQTWFGVPESTSCWKLEGFSEMVALLEDPPGDTEEGGDDGPDFDDLDCEREP